MIDILITAYRIKFYGFSFFSFAKMVKENKNFFVKLFIYLIAVIFLVYFSLKVKNLFFSLFTLIIFVATFRYAHYIFIKKSYSYFPSPRPHLNEVICILKTVDSEVSLFTAHHIEIIIKRLNEVVDKKMPFHNIFKSAENFLRTWAFPMFTFIGGICSVKLIEYGIETVISLGITTLALILCLYIYKFLVFLLFKCCFYSDYDAAIALKEDLKDIQLLYFCSNKPIEETSNLV